MDPKLKVPQHIAVIMDGNGRWAKKQGKPRIFGHKVGTQATRDVVRNAENLGVKYLTLYVFSTENWKRPPREVSFLMSLLADMIDKEVEGMMENNVRLRVLGTLHSLPLRARKKLERGIERTRENTGLQLNLAISYGGRLEIVHAAQKLAQKVSQGEIKAEEITEEMFSEHLYLPEIPDPELMIRTGGEYRISNYLLWQFAYSELFVTQKLWPDFDLEELKNAISFYQTRERRFGKVLDANE